MLGALEASPASVASLAEQHSHSPLADPEQVLVVSTQQIHKRYSSMSYSSHYTSYQSLTSPF